MKFRQIFIYCFIFSAQFLFSQMGPATFLKPSDTLNNSRKKAVFYTEVGIAGLSLVGLNTLWYSDFERSSFQAVDDSDEWLQIDKMGHVFSAYQLNRLVSDTYAWTGENKRNQLLYGSVTSLGFLTTIEIFDGFSEEWGFSWTDFASNFLGSGLYVGQELLWEEQRVLLKYSFHPTKYADLNPNTFGNGLAEEFIKDYNGQTYWLSINLASFFPESRLPKWLNLALGIGAHGMTGSDFENFTSEITPQRGFNQFFLSLDMDLTRIQTESRLLKTVFSVVNTLKIPFPTLEFGSKNPSKFHLLYF